MARLDVLPSSSLSPLQDPSTPIISNQSPAKEYVMELLDLNGGPKIPVMNQADGKSCSRNGTHKTTARFSCPTEEPIIVLRSSLTEMNNGHNHTPSAEDMTLSDYETSWSRSTGAVVLSPKRPRPSSSDGVILTSHRKALDWLVVLSDFFRSGLDMEILGTNVRRLLSKEGPLFHNNTMSLWGVNHTGEYFLSTRTLSSSSIPTFSLSQRRRRRIQQKGLPTYISGLLNQGQTCFLNSVLQSLASLPTFLTYLDGIVQCEQELTAAGILIDYYPLDHHISDASSTSSSKEGLSFTRQLLDLLDGINNLTDSGDDDMKDTDNSSSNHRNVHLSIRRRQCLNAKPLLRMIGEMTQQFRSHSFATMEQQDAQEVLSALLGVVMEEAQLDTLSDGRFMENVGRIPVNDSESTSYFDQVPAADEEDAMMTLAMANAGDSGDSEQLGGSDMNTLHNGNAGLALAGETNNLLSLSGFLSKVESEQKRQMEETNGDSLDVISAVKPPLYNPQGQPCDPRHFQEEKKQDHNEDVETLSPSSTLKNNNNARVSLKQHLPTSNQIRKTTISATTPSPLSGWIGSTVQCTKCKHVRPIQNAPFLDVPLVPISVPSYIGNAYHSPSQPLSPNSPSVPPCSLDDCLTEFTSVERVQDVECRFCTIQREIEHFEEEAMILRGAIETMEKRLINKTTNGNIHSEGVTLFEDTKVLRDDLAKAEHRLWHLRTMDPDLDDVTGDSCPTDATLEEEFLDLLDIGHVRRVPIERCEARKCLLLTRTPSILCCHIQRRYFDPYTNRMEKCVQHVEFPEILDISPYCAYGPRASTPWAAGSSINSVDDGRKRTLNDSQGRMPYRLRSIIEHKGNAYSGHYVAYRKDQVGRWYLISDAAVHLVSWQDVRRSQAYLLFYEAM